MHPRLIIKLSYAALQFLVITGSARLADFFVLGDESNVRSGYVFLRIAIALLMLMRLKQGGIYLHLFDQGMKRSLTTITRIWLQSLILLAATLYITGTHSFIDNDWLVVWAGLGTAGFIVLELALQGLLYSKRIASLPLRIAIVGGGIEGQALLEQLARSPASAHFIVGIFDDRDSPERDNADPQGHHRLDGTTQDLLLRASTEPLDRIIIALPTQAESRIRELIHRFRALPVDMDVYLYSLRDSRNVLFYQQIGDAPLLRIVRTPIGMVDAVLKRSLDLLLTGLSLPILLPVFLLIALAIKLDSPGPIFFRQERGGYRNQRFHIYKFRTMRHAKETHMVQAQPGDPRITRVGRILRRFSLDELPQLYNVLTGDLTLIGPRPHATEMDNEYAGLLDEYVSRTRVKPGLSGLAQIQGFRGLTDTPEKMQQRLRFDLYYINHWSFWLDLEILFKTFYTVIIGKNAV